MTRQCKRVMRYLDEFGSITPLEAFMDLGITKLATRISELSRYDGIEFKKEYVQSVNKWGEKVSYMRYRYKQPLHVTLKEESVE